MKLFTKVPGTKRIQAHGLEVGLGASATIYSLFVEDVYKAIYWILFAIAITLMGQFAIWKIGEDDSSSKS